MKISTKGRYALRLLVELACHDPEEYVALKDIAESQNISKKYLEQIVPLLTRGRLLATNRGYQGGYRLARDPSTISCWEVLHLTEGDMAPVSCLENGIENNDCPRRSECLTLPVWNGLYKVIREYLEGISIEDIATNANGTGGDDYII
ncbi:transcriptional regulator, BadM/Rrf2 family [Ruminococcaceae bacterium YRB3002]|nr:transcriptional regulator, BadM/Rrf2 family [Ruminococcaceae bacterium YRB3002]